MITLDSLTQNTVLSIGKQLENNSTDFIFNAETWLNQFPDGIIALLIKRSEEEDFYVANTGINFVNKTVSWMITSYDTEIPGYNLAEFQLISDGAVRKSATFKIYVTTSLYPGQAPHETPAPQWIEDYLSEFTALHSGTVQAQEVASIAADRAEEARERAQEEADRAKDEADRAESAATGSIEQAEEAAERAAESAQQAQAQATIATNQANRANNYATYANNYANNASRSASSANTQANLAANYATEASRSASSAYQSASLAETAVTNATAQADRAKDEADRAKDEADRAETAADNCENKAPSIEETEGPAEIANFPDGADNFPMRVQVQIEPVQDLHGYDNPWAGGAGKNLLKITATAGTTINGITYTVNENGSVTANGTATATSNFNLTSTGSTAHIPLEIGAYILSGCPSGGSSSTYSLRIREQNIGGGSTSFLRDTGNGVSLTVTDAREYARVYIEVINGTTVNNITFHPMIRLASETDATYEPYENICPISGWDKIAVTVSPTTQAADGETKTIELLQTVYGGTLTINKDGSGEVVVDRAIRQAPSAGWRKSGTVCYFTQSGLKMGSNNAISTHFPLITYSTNERIAVRTDKTEEEFNAQIAEINNSASPMYIVYVLATPSTIPLTPGQIKSLLGTNNVWSDAGFITVQYTADTKLFIEKYVASVGG